MSPAPKAPLPMARYREHEGEISLHMSHFFVGYLKDIYRLFEGDLSLVIVVAELAHHNLSAHFSTHAGLAPDVPSTTDPAPDFFRGLRPCNAYSLAAATGLPRETVRRKLLRMEALGWLERCGTREVRITHRLAEHFMPDFNVDLVAGLLETARRIGSLLHTTPTRTRQGRPPAS